MKYQITIASYLLAGLISMALILPAAEASAATAHSVLEFCPSNSMRYQEVKAGTATGDAATVYSIAECNMPADHAGDDMTDTTKNIINTVLSIVGIVAVVVMIMGGIGFVTSQGDTAKVTKSRNTILYGVVGLVIALLAFAIVNFVLGYIF